MNIREYIDINLKKTVRVAKENEGSLIALPKPFTTPCVGEMFLEMYYWDTYFTNVGMFTCGMEEQAKNNTENIMYMVEKYGFMPNGNRTYYLNRSQPPFLYLCVKDVFNFYKDKEWLKGAYKVLKKEYEFWQTKRRSPLGLNFYGNYECITEDDIIPLSNDFIKRTAYTSKEEITPEIRQKMAKTIHTFVESGWDCTSRFGMDGEHYLPVDLNSLLYGFESAMSEFSKILSAGEEKIWQKRAKERKALMDKYLWCEEDGLYVDYNYESKTWGPIRSAASLYPLFVRLADKTDGAKKLIDRLLLKYGVAGCTKENVTYSMQWDYPNVWAPIQYIAFTAAKNYGMDGLAEDIARRYINLSETAFNKTGNLWEKYNGNTGEAASNEYNAPPMMGWSAGMYLYFTDYLSK